MKEKDTMWFKEMVESKEGRKTGKKERKQENVTYMQVKHNVSKKKTN